MNTDRELTIISPSPDSGSGDRILFFTPWNDVPTVPSLFLVATIIIRFWVKFFEQRVFGPFRFLHGIAYLLHLVWENLRVSKIVVCGPVASVLPYKSAKKRPRELKYSLVAWLVGADPQVLDVWLKSVFSNPSARYTLLN